MNKKISVILILISFFIISLILMHFKFKYSQNELIFFPRAEMNYLYTMKDEYSKDKSYSKELEYYYKNSKYLDLTSDVKSEGEYTFGFSDIPTNRIISNDSCFQIVCDRGIFNFISGNYKDLKNGYFNVSLIKNTNLNIFGNDLIVKISCLDDEYLFGYASALYVSAFGNNVLRTYYPLEKNINNLSISIPQKNGVYFLKEIGAFTAYRQVSEIDITEYELINKKGSKKFISY